MLRERKIERIHKWIQDFQKLISEFITFSAIMSIDPKLKDKKTEYLCEDSNYYFRDFSICRWKLALLLDENIPNQKEFEKLIKDFFMIFNKGKGAMDDNYRQTLDSLLKKSKEITTEKLQEI